MENTINQTQKRRMSTTYGPHPGMEACGNGHSGSGSRGRSYRMGYGEAMPMMGGWKLDANDFVPSNNPRMPASIQQVNMEHDVANGQGWNREMKDFDTQGPTSTSQTHQTSSPPSMPNGSSSGGSTTTLLPSHSNDHSMYSMYSNSNSVDNYLDDPYSRSSRHYPTHTYTQRPHRHSSYPNAPDSQEDLQRELDILRSEVSDLRTSRDSDALLLSLKNREIMDLRSRLDEVRNHLLQIDGDGKPSLASAVAVAGGSSPSSTPGTQITTSMDAIATCLQRLQVSEDRRPSPPFTTTLLVDTSSGDGQAGETSPAQEEVPLRRRASLISSNSSASSVATAVGGNAGTGQQLSGVKSIWGPPVDVALPAGVGLYGQDALTQSPTEQYPSEPANATAPAAETILTSSASLNHFKNLWMAEDGSGQNLLQEYGICDGTEVYGMIQDDNYLNMSPNRIQHLGGMERNSNASFHYLVDKIVKTNDQPASLLLQQKLKTGNPEVRSSLFEAIRSQALPLIRNRFGNFLMQRCLEHGTPAQVRVLAGAMVGHIYALSCDRFGCHVVQKALDVCEDDVKLQIISELLRAIPETITHRFACHVWQRVFETRWSGANHRPRVAQRVDAALKGQWHLVANDENGSLVVQCVFENCEESDKGGIVREVLAHTVDIARGQWGNWVIQHLLEHGSPSDKQHILKVVARHVYSMSIDQFASKVVEKGLKTCQRRDLYDIVDMVLSPSLRDSGPGILDMMNNQYANYVVQHILTLSDPNQRDACARLIAPHLPILRGSKYGQRVAAIVEKHIRTSQQRFGTILSVTAAQHTNTTSYASSASSSSSSIHSLAAQSVQQQMMMNGNLYGMQGVPTSAWAHHMAQMPTQQMFAAGGPPQAS